MQCLEFGGGVALLYQCYTNIKCAFECLEMGSEIDPQIYLLSRCAAGRSKGGHPVERACLQCAAKTVGTSVSKFLFLSRDIKWS